MSETDDTDVLLLIPPNFFLVNTSGSEDSLLESSRTVVHKPKSCTAQVLGKLVGQVHSLESRLSNLEINSTTESVSTFGTLSRVKRSETSDSLESVDSKFFTFPRRRRRKGFKRDRNRDLSLTSLETTSSKNIPLLKLKHSLVVRKPDTNDSRSMDGDLSSIVSTPSKNNDKLLLNEIDEFLTKVEAYESPDSKFKDESSQLNPENVIKATSEYISHRLEPKNSGEDIKLPSGRIVPSTILDKYIYLVKNQSGSTSVGDSPLPTLDLQRSENNIKDARRDPQPSRTDTTKSPITRRLNFSDSRDVQPTSTPKRPSQQTPSQINSFQPSSNKIYDRATKVLEQYKSQNYSRTLQNTANDASFTSLKKDEFKMPQMRPYSYDKDVKMVAMQNKLIESIDTDLLSLSDLWGERGDKLDRGDSLKLEEERLKREHCEVMIQQLQKKILDQQEKLAVAMKVDKAKDGAIAKLKDAWMKITGSLDKAEERHRLALEKMVREVENFKMVADEAQKKTNHFETELYKTLDLAHDYQEKCKQLLAEKKQLEEGMEKALSNQREVISSKDKETEMMKENYDTVMRLNKQSTDCIRNLEEALQKEKSEHDVTKSKVTELSQKIQMLSDDTSLLLQERDLLKEKVKEERSRGNILERQLCDKQNQTSELLKKCDSLESELNSFRKHIELQKTELKVHYQKQLEDAVLAKLQEFQQQLDHAEKEMENDVRSKESAIMDNYNKQIIRIEEQHKLEVNVMEEKHKEEINLYRLQLAQASERIGLLDSKLESYKRRRGQIASQLHSVMEAQWRQALLILTGAPAALDSTGGTVSTPAARDYAPPKLPPPPLEARRDSPNIDGLSDADLQHYVKLLLSKPPNLEGGGEGTRPHDEPTSDRPERDSRDKTKRLSGYKPPWKA